MRMTALLYLADILKKIRNKWKGLCATGDCCIVASQCHPLCSICTWKNIWQQLIWNYINVVHLNVYLYKTLQCRLRKTLTWVHLSTLAVQEKEILGKDGGCKSKKGNGRERRKAKLNTYPRLPVDWHSCRGNSVGMLCVLLQMLSQGQSQTA